MDADSIVIPITYLDKGVIYRITKIGESAFKGYKSLNATIQLPQGLEEICDYITNILKNEDASNRLREKVMYNVLLLEKSPEMFVEIEKIDKTERNYRKIVINNYVILYTVDKTEKNVYIAHIYYGGRNYMDNLV